MPRFVILTHDHPALHWDLMLEKQADLRTWRLSQPADSPMEIAVEPLPAHRLAYLDYEGPISGNRGRVTCWDRGEYFPLVDREERVEFELHGSRLRGRAIVKQAADGRGWRFYFTPTSPVPPV